MLSSKFAHDLNTDLGRDGEISHSIAKLLARQEGGVLGLDMCLECIRLAGRLLLTAVRRNVNDEAKEDAIYLEVLRVINKAEAESIQLLVDNAEPRRPAATRLALEDRAIDAVFKGTEWSSAAEIGERINSAAANPHASVSRWQKADRVFGIDRKGKKLFPAYIFDDVGQPLPVVKKVLGVFAGYTPLRVASWFESTNSLLGGRRPREVIKSAPDAVLAAAQDHLVGPVHG